MTIRLDPESAPRSKTAAIESTDSESSVCQYCSRAEEPSRRRMTRCGISGTEPITDRPSPSSTSALELMRRLRASSQTIKAIGRNSETTPAPSVFTSLALGATVRAGGASLFKVTRAQPVLASD